MLQLLHRGRLCVNLKISCFNEISGYIRFVETARLLNIARTYRLRIRLLRRVGHFVPAGIPLLMISRADRLTHDLIQELRSAVDIGPTRTLQQDVEFGVIQVSGAEGSHLRALAEPYVTLSRHTAPIVRPRPKSKAQ